MPGTNFFTKYSDTLDIALTDPSGLATLTRGTGAAPTPANVFAHGCIYIRTDSGTGTPALYQNTGSVAVPSWSILDTGGGLPALTDAHIFVGNAGNVATDVAVTGDIGITNAGVTSITPDSIVNADINTGAAIAFSKLAALGNAQILIGNGTAAVAQGISGDIDLSPGGVVQLRTVATNNTGGAIAGGTLVALAVSGAGVTEVVLADADASVQATHVAPTSIGNGASGSFYPIGLVTGVDTSAIAVGNPVYLSTTAGEFTATPPSGATSIIQEVGQVVVQNALGSIYFYPGFMKPIVFGSNNIQAASLTKNKLAAGISASNMVVLAGSFTTVGGDVNEVIANALILNTDLAVVVMQAVGAAPVTIISAVCAAGQINVTMSADPSNDHILSYFVFRATT